MRRFWLIILLAALFAGRTSAQLLWEISGNGLPYKSYLFGTHHLVPVSFLDSIDGVYKAFNSCRAVVGEVAVNDPSLMKKMTDGARMPSYISMRELFSEKEYQKVDSALQSVLKLGLSELALLKPAMIANMYLVAFYQQLFPNASDEWQLDSFFQHVALYKNIPVIGLESVDEQINLLFNLQTLERQAFLLVGAVRDSVAMCDELLALNRMYRSGALDELHRVYVTDTTQYAYTQREIFAMLDERNDMWMRKLPKLMHEQPCFIAVGALHLPGESGLIALLRKAGYRVRRVR